VFSSTKEALQHVQNNRIEMIDLKIVGLAGQWLHVTIPASRFTADHFTAGVGYDGSSGSGFSKVESGDVCAMPRAETAFLDPFWERPTLSFLCDTVTADTKEPVANDPRSIAQRAVAYLRSTGVADEAWMGPEYEFHVFDHITLEDTPYRTHIELHCDETQPDGAGVPIPVKGGYLRVPPREQLHDFRSEVVHVLEQLGVAVRYHHHEVGAPGQCEIEVQLAPLVRAADQAMLIKYVIKNVARRHGKVATFMPKPVYGEAGNGMHVHQRLTRKGAPVFYDEQHKNYADLSDTALHYVAGLLKHGESLTGLTNPSTNSFKRLVEGHEAPVNLFFSLANRSAAIRVPRYAIEPDKKRIEYRPPDFTSNVYLALAGMLMAGLDGIQQQLDPAAHNFGPFDVDIARQDADFLSRITSLPRSLYDACRALEADYAYLTQGGVFSGDFIRGWAASKILDDTQGINVRPHPHEYYLYLDT